MLKLRSILRHLCTIPYNTFEKKYFDSLALKPLGLYVNLVGHLVVYSQPFNLVYRQLKSSDK
jgi:hypothetical protein